MTFFRLFYYNYHSKFRKDLNAVKIRQFSGLVIQFPVSSFVSDQPFMI